jgi:hypothetical protein
MNTRTHCRITHCQLLFCFFSLGVKQQTKTSLIFCGLKEEEGVQVESGDI